jgi:hypothetical protein
VPDWLVITADGARAGRGVRGYALLWFLRTYFGRRAVAMASPDDVRRSPIAADTAFVGLPSSFRADDIAALAGHCRRIVPFDYLDQHNLAWTLEQETALRRIGDHYLKPWFEPAWKYDLQMGLLPLRFSRRMSAAIIADRIFRRFGGQPRPKYDVAFLGRPNRTRFFVDGQVQKVDQRIDWLRELKALGSEINFWGGLTGDDHTDLPEIVANNGDISDLFYRGREVDYLTYWQALRHSRVLLAPGGNVPWTYRHYECLYAGGVVVTLDYRQRDLLVPLPRENMVHVPDGASVVPAVREALERSRRRPILGEENFKHLQYLRFGAYARSRPALIERFLAQLQFPGGRRRAAKPRSGSSA